MKNNKNINKIFGILGLVILLPILVNAQATSDSPSAIQQQIDKLAAEQNAITAEIQKTQNTLSAISNKGKTLKEEVKRLEANLRQVNLGIQSSENQIKKLQLEIQILERDIESQEVAVESRRAIAGELLRNLQIKDDENLLLILLKSESLAESVAEAQVIETINNNLLKEVSELRVLREKLESELEQITGKKRSVEVENKSLVVRKEVSEDQKKEQAVLLEQTKNQEKVYQSVLSELEQRQQALSNEIEEMETKLRASQDPGALPLARAGVLGWPTEVPYLTQGYGATEFAQKAYKSKFHNGIDLRARPVGQPLYAPADGIVMATGDNGSVQYGKYILMKHDNNLSTLLGHLSRFAVSEGDAVKRGDLVGYSGNTGYSFAPHLHFVVYISSSVFLKSFAGAGLVPVGSTLNPLDYLPSI